MHVHALCFTMWCADISLAGCFTYVSIKGLQAQRYREVSTIRHDSVGGRPRGGIQTLTLRAQGSHLIRCDVLVRSRNMHIKISGAHAVRSHVFSSPGPCHDVGPLLCRLPNCSGFFCFCTITRYTTAGPAANRKCLPPAGARTGVPFPIRVVVSVPSAVGSGVACRKRIGSFLVDACGVPCARKKEVTFPAQAFRTASRLLLVPIKGSPYLTQIVCMVSSCRGLLRIPVKGHLQKSGVAGSQRPRGCGPCNFGSVQVI